MDIGVVWAIGWILSWMIFTPFTMHFLSGGEPDGVITSFAIAESCLIAMLWPVIWPCVIIGAVLYIPSMLIYGFLFVRPKELREQRRLDYVEQRRSKKRITEPQSKKLTTMEAINCINSANNEEELERIYNATKRGIE